MVMGNLVLSIVGSDGGGKGYVCCKLSRKEDGGAEIWVKEEEEQSMRRKVEEEGCNIEDEGWAG
jgi:hypothetical protein